MLKKAVFSVMLIGILTGCAAHTGEQDIMKTIYSMEQALKESNIASLQLQVNEIRSLYDKNEWKIHLLGDEGEYERMNETINRLIAAIETEELSVAQLELATLKSIVKDIYSL